MTDDEQLTDLIAFDREHLWHPYSSALTPSTPYLVESASGVRLRLRRHNGEVSSVIDAMSSWWCAIHGYAVPSLDRAARDQLGRMSHVMFGGLTHEPAIALGRKLIDLRAATGGAGRVTAAARVPGRLGVGVGGGGPEDGVAVPRQRRATASEDVHDPRRLPRRPPSHR